MVSEDQIVVSIIMPTYNRANKIRDAINCVIKQSFKEWELLIIDNESTDNTCNIVESFTKCDNRIKYFNVKKSKNPGITDYLNFGIDMSNGDYIARLDDDDEWCDIDKLEKQVDFLNKNKNHVLVGGGAIVVDDQKNEIYRFYKKETDPEIRKYALYANPFVHSNVLFRKGTVLKTGGYKNIIFGEDWELWLRLGRFGKLYNFKQYFTLYSVSGQNFSLQNQKHVGKSIIGLIKEYKHDYPNYKKAIVLNFMQYLYSFTPLFIRERTRNLLLYIKRNYF